MAHCSVIDRYYHQLSVSCVEDGLTVHCALLLPCCNPSSASQIYSVRDRLETIHRFRIQLLLSLHERFVVAGQTSAATTATTTSSWLFGGTSAAGTADLAYQKAVREKFPFLELTNPVIFDTAAILLSGESGLFDAAAAALNGKTGTLYTTLDYFMFYSSGGMLFATTPEIVAVPLRTVALMEVVDSEGVVISCRYFSDDTAHTTADGGASVSIASTGSASTTIQLSSGKTVPASARLLHSIRLVDYAATMDVTVEVKGLTLDYCRRVGDLLDLIVRVSIALGGMYVCCLRSLGNYFARVCFWYRNCCSASAFSRLG